MNNRNNLDTYGNIQYFYYDSFEILSQEAAKLFVEHLKTYLTKYSEASIIISAGRTHIRALEILHEKYYNALEWNRVNLFHMDEFIGIECNNPLSQSYKLQDRIANKLPFKKFYRFCEYSPKKYEKLIQKFFPIAIAFQGIGANGHFGFNEPGAHKNSHARKIIPANATLKKTILTNL